MRRDCPTSRTPPSTTAPARPWRLASDAMAMPPMFDVSRTPWITSTSPGSAALMPSISVIWLKLPVTLCSGSRCCGTLRTVTAGPTTRPVAIVGTRIDAPTTPR